MLYIYLLCWYFKINFKFKCKRLKKNNIENIFLSSFFLLLFEMDVGFIFNEEYNCIFE